MEQRYGKKQLQTLVDTSLSENWLFNNSKKCPNCNAAIEVISRADLSKFKLGVLIIYWIDKYQFKQEPIPWHLGFYNFFNK